MSGAVNEGSANPTSPKVIALLVILVPFVLLVILCWPFELDDAFILLRYARNLAAGYGLTFNPGAPAVEGFSNLLYIVLEGLLLRVGVDPLTPIKVLGCLGAGACIPFVFLWCEKRGVDRRSAYLAAGLLACSSGFSFWALSGMETGFFAFLITLGAFLFVLDRRDTDAIAVILFLIASVTRSEAPIYLGTLGVLRLIRRVLDGFGPKEILRREATWTGLFFVLFCSYTAFRISYFGHLFPNPVYWKRTTGNLLQGSVSIHFVKAWLPFFVVAAFALRDLNLRTFAPLAMVLAALIGFLPAQEYVSGGVATQSYYDRYFMPVLPCFMVSVGLGFSSLKKRLRPTRFAGATWLLGAGLVVWQLFNPYTNPMKIVRRASMYEERIPKVDKEIADFLNHRFGPPGTVAMGDAGLKGYGYEGRVIDTFGLLSSEFTHVFHRDVQAYIGYILGEKPDAVLIALRSKEEKQFPLFLPEYLLTQRKEFTEHYEPIRSFGRTHLPGCFYVLYERISQETKGP